MEIHIAVADGDSASPSFILGAFSSSERAMGACQDYCAQTSPLTWTDFEAMDADYVRYTIILADLDTPV